MDPLPVPPSLPSLRLLPGDPLPLPPSLLRRHRPWSRESPAAYTAMTVMAIAGQLGSASARAARLGIRSLSRSITALALEKAT